jgi:hypothetical protein
MEGLAVASVLRRLLDSAKSAASSLALSYSERGTRSAHCVGWVHDRDVGLALWRRRRIDSCPARFSRSILSRRQESQ